MIPGKLQPSTRSRDLIGLPDIFAPHLSVVFCGVNPGIRSAALGQHFAGRGNRFWTVMHLAGFTPERIEPPHARALLRYGCGLTTVVERPTRRADQLARHEFVDAAAKLERKIERYAPRCIAFLGKVAYAAIVNQRTVRWGAQSTLFGRAAVWILPNPSGLNRAFQIDDLVKAYQELRESLQCEST